MSLCILIVDDDKYVVEKIVEGIDWKKWDIEGVYAAYNIRQAKEILSTLQVDILLSDIEMPQGSGLELLEWVRERKLPVECVYLSSYAHFAYAQKALELHSRGYLLKPVSNRELENVLEGLVEQMRAGKDAGGKDRQQAKVKYWRGLQAGEAGGVTGTEGNVYDPGEMLMLCMLRIFKGMEHRKAQSDAVFSPTLIHMTEELMRGDGYRAETIVRHSDDCFMIVCKGIPEEKEAFRDDMRKLLTEIERELHVTGCIYAGRAFDIGTSRERLDALLQMVREGVPCEEGILLEEEWRMVEAVYVPPDFSLWEQKMMRMQDIDEVSVQIGEYVAALWRNGQANVEVFGRFKADLQQMVFHFMMEKDILMNQIFEAGEFEHYCNKASWTLRDMKEFIRILFKKLKAVIRVEDTEENVVEQIIHYIEENLGGDLSRAKLAARAYISEDYLSKKFALHTGMSIPNYVSTRRMEKARDYFKNTARSVSEVATLVGYTNFSYFSKTFRDYAGCTPNEFRNRYNR